MRKLIYTGLLISSFVLGQKHPPSKDFETIQENDQWYLCYSSTNYPLNIIEGCPQLGDTQYRMEGLLEDKLSNLQNSLDVLKEKYYDSN